MSILTDKLTIDQQKEILSTLFGFTLKDYNDDKHFVLYDEEGDEFYGFNENLQFYFSTLKGIFDYTIDKSKNIGYSDAIQYAINKLRTK